jgi:hypothetical protein
MAVSSYIMAYTIIFPLFIFITCLYFVHSQPLQQVEANLFEKRHCPWGRSWDPEIVPPCYGNCTPHPTFNPCIKTVVKWDPRLNFPCAFNGLQPGPIIIGNTPPPGPIFIPAILTTQTLFATPPVVIPFPTFFTQSVLAISTLARVATTTVGSTMTTTSVDTSAAAMPLFSLMLLSLAIL